MLNTVIMTPKETIMTESNGIILDIKPIVIGAAILAIAARWFNPQLNVWYWPLSISFAAISCNIAYEIEIPIP